MRVLIENKADVDAVNAHGNTPILLAILDAKNDAYIETVLFLFCIGRARITQKIRDISRHRFDGIMPLLKRLRRDDLRNDHVFTQEERKFLYDFAFVLAIKYPGLGEKIFYSALQFMSYSGCFMSRLFHLDGRWC